MNNKPFNTDRSQKVRVAAARLFLKILLPLISLVVFINAAASIYPVFYPQRLLTELGVLLSVIPAYFLYKAKRDVLSMFVTLGLITVALSFGVIQNGGVLSPAYVALMIMVVFVQLIVPWWGTIIYSFYTVSLGLFCIYFTEISSYQGLPSPTYYWVMYTTYTILLVAAQVVISKLFNRILEQNIEREDQLISAINSMYDPLIITDRALNIQHVNRKGSEFIEDLEQTFHCDLLDVSFNLSSNQEGPTTLRELCQSTLSQDDFLKTNQHEVCFEVRGSYSWYLFSFTKYSGGGGIVIHARDTTPQHRIVQAQKMNAVGQLSGGIAHEFNNMLSIIKGSVELLNMDPRTDQEELIEYIDEGVQRASRLTQQLLMFTQRKPQFQKVIDLHKVIENTVALLEGSLHKKLNLLFVQGTTSSCIQGDDRLLMSAIMNLVINAGQAMPDGGVIILKSSELSEELKQKDSLWTTALNHQQKYISLEVIDHGVGISADVLAHIFEPFFSTRESTSEGIGLTAVYGAVNKHSGAIRVTSEQGKGSIFQVVFPLTDKPLDNEQEQSTVKRKLPIGLKILLVDDEKMITQTLISLLRPLKPYITTAHNGLEGVKYFQEEVYDLVILDVMMPMMDGIQALKLMREHNHQVPVLIHSGYASDQQLEELSSLGISKILSKPASKSDLFHAMKLALADPKKES